MQQIKKILFLCVENSARSQMAEAFFHAYSKKFQAISAGTNPSHNLNPLAIQAMKEVGIDITSQKSKLISDEMIAKSSSIINMGCLNRETCPVFATDVIDWNISDPKGKSIEEVRKIREQIRYEVLALIKKLEDNL